MAEELFNWPNAITLLRLVLVPFVVESYLAIQWGVFFTLVVVFVVLDVLDGFIARKLGQLTQFGKNFDVAVDAVLGISLFLTSVVFVQMPVLWLGAALLHWVVFGIVIFVVLWRNSWKFINSKHRRFGGTVNFLVLGLLLFSSLVPSWLFWVVLCLAVIHTVEYCVEQRRLLLQN